MSRFEPRPADPHAAARIGSELGIHPVTAHVLAARGVADPEAARAFLKPHASQMHPPGRFRDMDRAVAVLAGAVRAGERIAIYGDYDVDGVCATAVMQRTLALLGADTLPFIPHRVTDGYGLRAEALERLREQGCRVVVTVDNGTSRADEIAAAQANGLRVVVTDHHEPGPVLPPCPVVNPKRADADYPFKGLAGCGVAFKVALALVEEMGLARSQAFQELWPDLLATVALGTVADVVPLRDENRALVALGLRALAQTRRPGLRALLEVAGCLDQPLRPTDVGFKIGPRINAAGRLGSAQLALDLILCEDPAEAAALAQKLDAGNRERQRIEREAAEEAFRQAEAAGDAPALVLAHEDWHPGIIGIVAARVAEKYHRPAALIALETEVGRGSARCFSDVRLHEALEDCSAHLTTHGGHAAAAGFTLVPDRVDAFRAAFQEAVAKQDRNASRPRLVDAELPIDAITAPLAAELEMLGPFGMGNEEPVFCAFDVRAAGRPRRTGQGERHLSFYAASDRTAVRAVAFNQAEREDLLAGRFDLSYVLRRRKGQEPVEIHVRELVARP